MLNIFRALSLIFNIKDLPLTSNRTNGQRCFTFSFKDFISNILHINLSKVKYVLCEYIPEN